MKQGTVPRFIFSFKFPAPAGADEVFMKKLSTFFFQLSTFLFLLLLLTGCSSSSLERNYRDAETLLEQGQYEKAAAKYSELGSYEDASRLLMYCRAALAAESGDYQAARDAFTALGSFHDAPQMLRYFEGREIEDAGRRALSEDDYSAAVDSLKSAVNVYQSLADFRDSYERGADCINILYDRAVSLLSAHRFPEARDLFAALDTWRDSAELKAYCDACILELDGLWLQAADVFSSIPSVLDAAQRADADRELIYQQACSLSAAGELESAILFFSELGSYRDSESQAIEMARQMIHSRLRSGDYEGALFALDAVGDAITLEPAGLSFDRERAESFLDGFADAYLHFSANSMDAYSGYFGTLPYIEPGGALDQRFKQFLMIGSFSHNSYYSYEGSTLLDVLSFGEDDYYLAYLRASASVNQPKGPVHITRTFRITLHDTDAGLIAGSIEDCLYDQADHDGRPVITGPLPKGQLPPDEDGDGIIVVDVMKKGFNGTMIIVLDPSRVFAGGPGFYGGNGMVLEDLVNRYDALGGINGGGFIDEDGGGSGGYPEGLTIVDGKSYFWAGSGESAAFDENNVLHVGGYTIETAAEAHIRDCVSFGPALIVDGVPEYGSYMESGINPRTAIGQRPDGSVLMLVIDGRQIHSIGASYGDIRDVMIDFGAVNAVSLDGGSSTVMYLNGQYMNSPSSASGTSRYLPNAFLIRK